MTNIKCRFYNLPLHLFSLMCVRWCIYMQQFIKIIVFMHVECFANECILVHWEKCVVANRSYEAAFVFKVHHTPKVRNECFLWQISNWCCIILTSKHTVLNLFLCLDSFHSLSEKHAEFTGWNVVYFNYF